MSTMATEKMATRDGYGKALCELGEKHDFVVLCADLSDPTRTVYFEKRFPERFIQCGIAEANMMSIAAGVASTGKVAFASTFAMFAAGRAYEQIRNSIAYPHLNVKIGATHAGLSVGEDGATHQCIEDIALMRVIPGMTVLSPCDGPETMRATEAALSIDGPVYIRIGRSAVETVSSPDVPFVPGKGIVMAEGKDTVIIATGLMVCEALKARALLAERGIDAGVINIHTIKPMDDALLADVAAKYDTIRLWRARQVYSYFDNATSQNNYVMNMTGVNNAEQITKQLYPADNYDEGKLLRLTQQYFLVSASLQSIISDYFADHGSLHGFEDKVSIHINDTHPALAIPELMRILMDVYSYSWDDAWAVVVKTISYTNHTVLPEALECWRVDLFSVKLPRIFMIVNEINRRFTADLWNMYPGDWDRISRMSIVAYNQVRMANLSIVGSHTVNGVSALHSDILKKTIFHDFYKMTPWKFTNVTNGVVHRRWLNYSNPGLAGMLDELIGPEFREDASNLIKLEAYKDDPAVLSRILDIKHRNKEFFSYYCYNKTG